MTSGTKRDRRLDAMAVLSSETVHATCVAIDGKAVLLMGESGSGKSDLALRLVDRGAVLVSDDYTRLEQHGQHLLARAPATIAGQMEVRHVGIVKLPFAEDVPVYLAIYVDAEPERLPDGASTVRLAGIDLRCFTLNAREASAPIKVELLLQV
jgi:serine kinase of HPr protein (carbohydrate metabolism regulator)